MGPSYVMDGCRPSTPKMDSCKVEMELDKTDGVYYAGQKLGGVVKVELSEPLLITGLELRLLGSSAVCWRVRREPEHSAAEVYFDDTYILWGNGRKVTNPEVEELPRGRHLFPFQWTIPVQVPSSYEGPCGWVRYTARATLLKPCCRPGCNTALSTRSTFTVLHKLDLNLEPDLACPVRDERDACPQSRVCRGGKVACSLELPRSGFVAGEFIQADVDINNLGPHKIRSTSLTLKQVIRFGSDDYHSHKLTWEICRIHGDKVKPWKHQCWSTKRGLAIPAVVPSRMDGCKYIDVSYEIHLLVEMQGGSVHLNVPITVGTDPFYDSYLTSWNYRECLMYKNKKRSGRSHAPLQSCRASVDALDLDLYLPRYRVFNVQNPRKTVVVFTVSPGERRRSMATALHHRPTPRMFLGHNHESEV